MNQLKVGFSRVNITPMLGITMAGYYETRYAEGVLDDLELTALAVSDSDTTALLISMDIVRVARELALTLKKEISDACGVPADCIYLHAIHTHTGPTPMPSSKDPLVPEYLQFLARRAVAASKAALEDLKQSRMGWAVGTAPNVAFIRRFRMKDGSIQTNPGINNPQIDAPIGEVDRRVNLLRFDREGGKTLVLVNFGNHPDTIGGNRFSADWPGFMRRTVEQALPECNCVFFNGIEGDVNHINVFPKDTDRPVPDLTEDRYLFSQYVGRAMAGTVLQEYDKVRYSENTSVRCRKKTIQVPTNMPNPEDLPRAHQLHDMYVKGQIEELRKMFPNMQFETTVGEANRMVALENGPEFFEMDLIAVSIGKVALIGYPGEPFTAVGTAVKETEGYDLILPTCMTGGAHGYFPTMDAYAEGGYEVKTSRLKAGVAELMIKEGKDLLQQL